MLGDLPGKFASVCALRTTWRQIQFGGVHIEELRHAIVRYRSGPVCGNCVIESYRKSPFDNIAICNFRYCLSSISIHVTNCRNCAASKYSRPRFAISR